MPGAPAVVLRLPAAAPDRYLALARACRLGLGRGVGDVTAEELGGGPRWALVNQAVTAYLEGRGEVAPRVAVGPDVAEMLTEYVAADRDLGRDLGAGRPVAPEVVDLAKRCVDALREQLLPLGAFA
ncbi:MAG TPA: hypothetical protein VHL78_13405 [Actinomycetota bacterium]|nr:hypothetical protein [Actinomycetota bacterium]